MARLGIVQSTSRVGDSRAIKQFVDHVNKDVEILELRKSKGNLEEQILHFLSEKEAVLFVLLSENSTLHFIAGIAVGLGRKIGYLCDSSIYLPISFREHPFSIIHRADDLEIAITSIAQKILHQGKSDQLVSALKRASEFAVNERRVQEKRALDDRHLHPSASHAAPQLRLIENSEHESPEIEAEWTRKIVETLGSSAEISASFNPERERDEGFDFILWNSSRESSLSIFENPIAVEVKAAQKLDSKQVTKVLNDAQRQNIRSVLFITRASVPPSLKSNYMARARKRGVTLGFIDAIQNGLIDSQEALLDRLSIGSTGD